jgi:hypothetical protein
MRTSIAAVTALAGSLLLTPLMLGPAMANAPDVTVGNYHLRHGQFVAGLSVGDYGHPDPCWSLRVQTMTTFSPDAQDRFEGCLAHYNYNN